MQPAVPDEPTAPGPQDSWLSADAEPGGSGEVGDFRQGTPASRWALARYLVGRAIAESVGITLLIVAVLLLGLAALCQYVVHSTFLAVLVGLVAVAVLLVRVALLAVLRRLTAADRFGTVEQRLRALVSDTRSDVLRELRRVGLPGHMITLPLLAVRLFGRRRVRTLTQLRSFELGRAVPGARLDELHLLLRDVAGTAAFGRRGGNGRGGTDPFGTAP